MHQPTLETLRSKDLPEFAEAFAKLGWNKPAAQYARYLAEQTADKRNVIVARVHGEFAGYVTLVWQSEYPAFASRSVPEICDLNVLPTFRRRGIGETLVRACEAEARKAGHAAIGLGVGLIADYGSAQRLYVRLGYTPDGRGLHAGARVVGYNESIVADDDLVLYFEKILATPP